MDIHLKDCWRYLRFSGCTQAITISSTYDVWIIVHYQLLNHTIVPSISSTFYCLHPFIKKKPKKMATDLKIKVGKTETIT